jgi:hypothetical protein
VGLRLFHGALALDAGAFDALARGARGRLGVGAFALRLVDDDALELLLLVEEVGDVEEGVALQPDVDEGRLHAGQHAHDAPLVDVADDALRRLAALDVELGDAPVLDDGDLLLAPVDADD